ncbi:MAG: hypothetical protein COB38_08935 [Gammaproteobacteria bacterium]|nr:MAG: hypothetical protein COB38_08935 [Gammaproteobacteria bacterium]
MNKIIIGFVLLAFCLSIATTDAKRKKKPRYMPYSMVQSIATDTATAVTATKSKLQENGFRLLGEYSPLENTVIIAITNDELLKVASSTEFGGYGAVIRVAVTKTSSGIQLSHVNPVYMSFVYQMESLSGVVTSLETALGKAESFGSEKGLTKKSLKGYQYMMFMPEFDDHDELGSFDSHASALQAVKSKLASGSLPLTKVFEIKIPGKDEVLIGVGIKEGDGSDSFIMKTIDVSDKKHSAHLPYGVLISGNKVYSQAGKFRIALAFPDLGMGQFMDISDAPDGIKDSLGELAK